MMFRNPFPAWVAMLLVLGSVSEYLLPITYHINSEGAKARFGLQPASIRWSEVRRVVHRRGGVLLSPLSEPSRLDGFRGVYLRFGRKGEAGQRLEVLSAIRAYLPQLEEKSTETTPALQGAIES